MMKLTSRITNKKTGYFVEYNPNSDGEHHDHVGKMDENMLDMLELLDIVNRLHSYIPW